MNNTKIFTEKDMANAFGAGYDFCTSHEYLNVDAPSYEQFMKDEYNIKVKHHYILTFSTEIEGPMKTIDLCYAADDAEAMRAGRSYFFRAGISPAYMAIERTDKRNN